MSSLDGGEKLPLHVIRDNAKWVFLPTKIILSVVMCWPENRSKLLFWLQYFCVFVHCFFLYGQIYTITHADSGLAFIILSFNYFIVTMEGLARYHMLMTKREDLNNLLNIMYHDFWSSKFVGESVNSELLVNSRRIISIVTFYTLSAFICSLQCIGNAVFYNYFPLLTTYPYDWQKSPYYELMLCFQSIFTGNLSVIITSGDWLLFNILLVYVAQFKLLKTYVKEHINAAILNDQEFQTQTANKKLLFALNHHKKLLQVSENINGIFQYYILFQFLISTIAVCTSTFIITFLPQERLSGVSYLLGRLFQIFIYCYMGNELLFESADLSDHFFHCGWHLTGYNKHFQKSLILGMMRSQHPIKIKAGGFGYLQLSTFVNLVKFSFSVFTLLQTFMEN